MTTFGGTQFSPIISPPVDYLGMRLNSQLSFSKKYFVADIEVPQNRVQTED